MYEGNRSLKKRKDKRKIDLMLPRIQSQDYQTDQFGKVKKLLTVWLRVKRMNLINVIY